MDARTPPFLAEHVDFTRSPFELELTGPRAMAYLSGQLRGPEVPCLYIARVPCDENLVIRTSEPVMLDLDMTVPELGALDVRFSELDRLRDRSLIELWIDDEVRRAWEPLDGDLIIHHGTVTLSTQLSANDGELMRSIGVLMQAISTVPVRRADQLARALDGCGIAKRVARLRLDESAIALAGSGAQVMVAYGREHRLRTVVRVYQQRELAVSEDGFVSDPARLQASVAAIGKLVSSGDRPPYR